MTPDVVVDIGNTAIKLAACELGVVAVANRVRSYINPDDKDDWSDVFRHPLGFDEGRRCAVAVASVHPERTARFTQWLERAGHTSRVISDWKTLPIAVDVDFPEQVGIDRLLNAVAAKRSVPPGTPAIMVSAGTAVTVDLLNAAGAFAGGAIMPGPRLMASALHTHTAKLPLVDVGLTSGYPPGRTTTQAIRLGIDHAVVGGVELLIRKYARRLNSKPMVLVTGGDAYHLVLSLPATDDFDVDHVPALTLEGIRIAAEAIP